jgi:hypothetical protein
MVAGNISEPSDHPEVLHELIVVFRGLTTVENSLFQDRERVRRLTPGSTSNPLNAVQLRPLALEIFTLIGGMWFDPWTDTISPGDKAHLVEALGYIFDVPDLSPGL